jgi:hypothetical protein
MTPKRPKMSSACVIIPVFWTSGKEKPGRWHQIPAFKNPIGGSRARWQKRPNKNYSMATS